MTADSVCRKVLLLNIKKSLREREREITPPTIHRVVINAELKRHSHLGIFHFIPRLRLYKLNMLSLLSASTANSKMVYYQECSISNWKMVYYQECSISNWKMVYYSRFNPWLKDNFTNYLDLEFISMSLGK